MKKLLVILLCAGAGIADAQTLHFSNKADMTTARGGFSADNDGTFEYTANGFSPLQPFTSQIEKYDFANNSWSVLATSIPCIAKRYGNGVILAGNLYLYNGITATGKNDKLEIVNLTTGNLTLGDNLNPNPVSSAGSALYGDYLLSFGGCVNEWEGVYTNKFYKIAPWGEWFPLADMPVALETKGVAIYGTGNNSKLYAFGGYSHTAPVHENFETAATTGTLSLANWINVADIGNKLFQGKVFGGNKYAQITAFTGIVEEQETMNSSWLISPNINLAASGSYLTFDTKDGYDNGATLQAYAITNWTGDINTCTKTLLSATISTGHTTGYGTDFVGSGIIPLAGISGDFRVAFKYTGGYQPLATTTYQIDNVKVYQEYKSNSVYVYDFASNTWTTHPDVMPQTVSAHDVAIGNTISGTEIYVAGDYDNQTFLGRYDTTNNTFTTLSQTNMVGRRHHAAEVVNNALYLFGGNTSGQASSALNSTQSADLPSLDTSAFGKRQSVSFYPNPADDKITFSSNIKNILLFTFEGKKIEAQLLNNQLDLTGLGKGVYLLQGTDEDGNHFSNKLIKN